MFSIPLPWEGSRLLLTPQWHGLPFPLEMTLLALVCLVPLVLIVWLYFYELRLVPFFTAIALLGLRLAVLTVLLGLVCLQPVYTHSRTTFTSGRVIVAVDRSDSMDVRDPQRPPADKLRLALALHLVRDFCDDNQLDAWIRDYATKGEPQWVGADEAADDPIRRQELTETRRRLHERVCKVVDVLTRTEAARRVLDDDGVRLLSTLAARHDVEVIGFNRDAWDAPLDNLDVVFKQREGGDAKEPAAPRGSPANPGSYTDLRLPLVRALERSGAGQAKVLGVVVLTDGRHNAGDPPVKKALELGDRKLPIFPIALGAPQPPADLTLVSIKAPPAVYKDANAAVDVRFRVAGMARQKVVVELFRGAGKDKKLVEEGTRTIDHDGVDREYTESFQVRMDQAGSQTLTATVRPDDPKVEETTPDNNSRSTVVNVARDEVRVLLIDGEARWEYHYLASMLERDKTIQVRSVVFDQPRLRPNLTPKQLDEIGSPQQQTPPGEDGLADFDCVILGDASAAQMPLAERQRLEKFVAERGGTLVVVAGKRYMPLGYPESKPDGEADPLRKMLPIEAPRVVAPKDDGFHVSLTQEARETKFMHLEDEATASEKRWADLPPHYWGVVGRAKPAAATLAYVAEGAADPKDPGEREKRNALIAWQHYGFGRVLYVGVDSTWRWRKGVGDVYHHRFWGQVARWASDRPLGAGNNFVRFGATQPVYHPGQEVEVSVRFKEGEDARKADPHAEVHVVRRGGDGKPVAVAKLTRKAAQPNAFEAKVANLPEGDYDLELSIPDLADKLLPSPPKPGEPDDPKAGGSMRVPFTVEGQDSDEMLDLSTNRPLLDELAAKSGGKVYTPEDAQQLVDKLVNENLPHTDYFEQKLWQWWVLLVLVVSLLTVEWAARKLSGLP